MRILNSFKKEMNQTAKVYSREQGSSGGSSGGYITESNHLKGELKGFLFTGSTAESIVSEKLRPRVDAVLIIDPLKKSFDLNDTDKVIIGKNTFNIVTDDDIGNQGEATSVYLKKDT